MGGNSRGMVVRYSQKTVQVKADREDKGDSEETKKRKGMQTGNLKKLAETYMYKERKLHVVFTALKS